jgi:tetratricopeptide (TPR) repeat protein
MRRHAHAVPKPSKTRHARSRRAAWPWIVGLFVIAVLGLAWWQVNVVRRDTEQFAAAHGYWTNAPGAAASNTVTTSSNAFDMAQFSAWVTNQSNVDELLGSGGRWLGQGRADLGFLCFHRVVELKPEHEEAWFNLGVALVRLGEFPEAEYAYRRAISNFNEYAEARNNLGNLFTRQKRYTEAAEQFNTVLEQTPDNAAAHNNLGRVLAEQGNSTAALERFTEAARLDTNYLEARFNMGNALLTMGQTNEAVASFREAVRLRPDFQPALNALAKLRRTP